MKIIIIHGPNLNLLGRREQDIYDSITLDEINEMIKTFCKKNNTKVTILQSNSEGEIIDFIHENDTADGLIINPAAYTHTSVAIRDAIKAVNRPAVEVHLSNIHAREEFRSASFVAPVCIGQISGFGPYSYILGIRALIEHIQNG
jgi:3-dehydroquinate dehydratase-2